MVDPALPPGNNAAGHGDLTCKVMGCAGAGPLRWAMAARMPLSPPPPAPTPRAGVLLREWRAARRMSQLDLALAADVSTRHLSCVETGKSQASQDMVMRLADALEMPLRERNALLMAAGYAPSYPETALGTPALAQVRRATEFILAQQEPYPAFVLNRHWDIVMANEAARKVTAFLLGDGRQHGNMIRHFFDPEGLRAAVVNWEEVAGDLVRHLHGDVASAPSDQAARALLDEALAYPGVPARWRTREPGSTPSPLLTTAFRRGEVELRFFSTFTTFGTPRDVTVDELRIECCFPDDDATAAFCRTMAAT